MLNMLVTVLGATVGGPTVIMPNDSQSNFRTPTAPCHCKCEIRNTGSYHLSDNTGNYGAADGSWLNSGNAEDVWVERGISGDALDVDEISTSRVQLNAHKEFGYENSTHGPGNAESGTVTLSFYDAASGGSLLDTALVTLTAEYDNGS